MSLIIITTICFIMNIHETLQSNNMLDCALGRVDGRWCLEDGGWGLWSSWGPCEGECGGVGRQIRTRNCSNPHPANNGASCSGDQREVKQCSVAGCSYEKYEELLAQDVIRIKQLETLKKLGSTQSALLTKCISSNCNFADVSQALPQSDTKFWNALQCVKKNTGCPDLTSTNATAAGGWGDWSLWTRCSARCGSGKQMRCRACCDPPPSSVDFSCQGETCEYQPCTGVDCGQPLSRGGEWSQWSAWSSCSSPCNFGISRRSRVCRKESQNSDKKAAAINSGSDYTDVEDYADVDDYYNGYVYNNDRVEQRNYGFGDRVYDDDDDNVDSAWKLAKRSQNCDKVEYYNNDEEDSLSTSSRPRRTTRRLARKTTEYFKKTAKTTVSENEEDSWIFKQSQVPVTTSGVETKTKNSFLSSTERASELPSTEATLRSGNVVVKSTTYMDKEDLGHMKTKTLKTFNSSINSKTALKSTTDTVSDEEEDDGLLKTFKIKTFEGTTKTKFENTRTFSLTSPSYIENTSSEETNLKSILPKSSRKPKLKKGRYHIPDPILLDETEGRSNNHKNDAMDQPAIECGKCTGELYKNSSTAGFCEERKNNPTTVYITNSASASRNPANEKDLLTSILFPSQSSKSVFSFPETSLSSPKSVETKFNNLEPTTVPITGGQVPLETSSSSTITTEEVTVSQQTLAYSTSVGSLSSRETSGNISTNSSTSVSTTLPEGSSTVPTSTLPHGSSEANEPLNQELNMSINHSISCNLATKLELPSFNSSFPGEGCSGPFEEIKPCNTQSCNEDGSWSSWSSWSACSADCGLGMQISIRSCTNPEPRNNGSHCEGESTLRQSCYLQPCPVHLKTAKAIFMTGDSVIKYEALHQHSSILLLYVRFRHFYPTGNVVVRRPLSCHHDKACDHVTLALYSSHILVSVRQQKCQSAFLSSQRFTTGDWHEVLLTIVGAVVTLRLDDSVQIQSFNLTCRPPSPNYDSDMKLGGGHFVGELDRLVVNFKNFAFQKKRERRDAWTWSEVSVSPVESSQVQYEVNSVDAPSVSLTHFLQAPCFTNRSSWKIELAIKPQFPDGLVLFVRGYNSRDFLFVSLEQTKVRLRVRAAAQSGECEHPGPVAPQTWLYLVLSRPPGGPVGLSVDGGPRCVVNLDTPTNSTEEPVVYCTDGIFFGEMPLSVKTVLASEHGHVEPVHSPLGILGFLSIDNHTLDLTMMPRKIAPDLSKKHPNEQYRLSSHTAATTVYYEEMLVLHGEHLSMPCIYDLSRENVSDTHRKQELGTNWYRLDVPVETAFLNDSGVRYEITTTGKSTSLKVTSYRNVESVEGVYSCWLHYHLPLQTGLNIVTYGVIIVSTNQDRRTWLYWIMMFHFGIILVLLLLILLWLLYEAYQDYKRGSGYYRCKKLKDKDASKAIHYFIYSDKGVNRLGGIEAAERAFQRYLVFLKTEAKVQAVQETETPTDTEVASVTDNTEETHSLKSDEMKPNIPNKKMSEDEERFYSLKDEDERFYSIKSDNVKISIPKSENRSPRVDVVFRAAEEFQSPFSRINNFSKNNNNVKNEQNLGEARIPIEVFQESDTEDGRGDLTLVTSTDNLIDVSQRWKHKEVTTQTSNPTSPTNIGHIQDTSAYRSIQSELKFEPERFKNLEKYYEYNKKAKK